jgi:hypothetical protein
MGIPWKMRAHSAYPASPVSPLAFETGDRHKPFRISHVTSVSTFSAVFETYTQYGSISLHVCTNTGDSGDNQQNKRLSTGDTDW